MSEGQEVSEPDTDDKAGEGHLEEGSLEEPEDVGWWHEAKKKTAGGHLSHPEGYQQ